jgi:predicted nucleotide-binding protein
MTIITLGVAKMTIENCAYCNGTGKDPNTGPISGYKPCPVCKGYHERTIDIPEDQLKNCVYCNETGIDPNTGPISGYKPCPVCEGWGLVARTTSNLSKTKKETMSKEDSSKILEQPEAAAKIGDRKSVFVVYGRNLKPRDALFQFLRSIGLKPLEWSQAVLATGKTAPYIGEVLDQAFSMAQAIVVLMTPDDEGRLISKYQSAEDHPYEKELTPQPRLNVVFEAGLAMGRKQDRTVLIELGKLRPFSDIGGRHILKMDNSVAKRQDLAQRLKNAGCDIDLSGTDWHRCGEFIIN